MKNIKLVSVLFLAILLFAFRALHSQNTAFSVHFAPMVSWFKPNQMASNEGLRLGIRGGLDIDRFFAHHYSFQTGIYLQRTGGRLSFPDSIPVKTSLLTDTLPAGSTMTYRLQHLTIPLGLKFKTDEIGYLSFYFNMGFLPQLRLKAESDAAPGFLKDADIRDEIALFHLGYHFGAGAEYSLGGITSLLFGFFYEGGISDMTKRDREQIMLKSIGIKAGILF